MPDPVDSDDEAEPAGLASGNACECILEHGRLARSDLESFRGREEGVRRGLSPQVLLRSDDPVDSHLEQIRDPGCLENVAGVRARGDDSAPESASPAART